MSVWRVRVRMRVRVRVREMVWVTHYILKCLDCLPVLMSRDAGNVDRDYVLTESWLATGYLLAVPPSSFWVESSRVDRVGWGVRGGKIGL